LIDEIRRLDDSPELENFLMAAMDHFGIHVEKLGDRESLGGKSLRSWVLSPGHLMTETRATVLVVEDEPEIRRFLRSSLGAEGYRVVESETGERGAVDAATHKPDLAIVDLGLPDLDGVQVIRRIRAWSPMPVIVLSARAQERSKIEALDAGADDYVTKPFGMDEFLARLRAAVRRGTAASDTDEPVVETSSFTVDLAAKKVTKNGSEVHLTPTEWGMLEMLVRNRGKLVGREELLKEVWGPAYAKETHYLRVYLAQLRRKLEDDPSHPVHLLTEAGMGYRFQQ